MKVTETIAHMKGAQHTSDSSSNLFLTGSILFANLDYSGFTDYGIKAVIGGAIWMVFKLAGEFFSQKIISKSKKKLNETESK